MSVTIVIKRSVAGEEAALSSVRLQAGFKLDTITCGYKKAKIVKKVNATVRQVIKNTHPNCARRRK